MFMPKEKYTMQDLIDIVALLRHPESGCPWDKVQTHLSIRKSLLEEAYEVADAIDLDDSHLMCEELGDLLLQIVFHTQLEAEQGAFSMDDVLDGICKKLVLRHPHIFSTVNADTADKVLENWENIKKEEKGRQSAEKNLDDVPKALPALMRAQKLQKRAAQYGYDYHDADGAIKALDGEIAELKQAVAQNAPNISEEMGDVLFSAVNVARHLKQDSEETLTRAAEKFAARVKAAERLANESGNTLDGLTDEELDKLWRQAKVCTER